MFQDQEFLLKYFREMREKIANDLENIDRYFPEDAHLPGSKLYSSPQTA